MDAPKVRAYQDMTVSDMKFTDRRVSWCQGVGAVPAISAFELKPGMWRVYNTGAVSKVLAVEVRKASVYYSVQTESGKIYENVKSLGKTLIPVCVDAAGKPVQN